MPFWNHQQLLNHPFLRAFEGVFVSFPSHIPHVALLATTLLFQTPQASPLFVFTSLPILVHLCKTSRRWDRAFFTKTGGIVFTALTGNSLSTCLSLLDDTAGAVSMQTLFSVALTVATIAPVLAHRYIADEWGCFDEDGWDVAPAFGTLWAVSWAVFSRCLPFGRYGTPTPSISDFPSLAIVERWLGLAGVDMLIGTSSYITYQTGRYLLPAVRRPADDLWQTVSSSRFSFLSDDMGPEIMQIENGDSMHTASLDFGSSSNDTVPSSRAALRARGQGRKFTGLAAVSLWAGLLATGQGETPSLSAALSAQTPFGLGYVLPRPTGRRPTIDDLVHEAQTIANRVNLLIFPENAYVARTGLEGMVVVERIVEEVCKQYGVWVQLGMDNLDGAEGMEDGVKVYLHGHINQVVLLGPDGMIGAYSKQKLVPFVESVSITRGLWPVPTWDIYMAAPPGVNRTDWTPKPPHVRPIRIAPAICLDSFDPGLFRNLHPAPDLFTISASSPSILLGRHLLGRAESLAITHGVPVALVASGKHGRSDGSGISALLDGWGRHLHSQRGGKSAIIQVALPYAESKERRRTGAEYLGTRGILGAGIVLLGLSVATTKRKRRAPTDDDGDRLSLRTVIRSASGLFGSVGNDTSSTRSSETTPLRSGEGVRPEASAARHSRSMGYSAVSQHDDGRGSSVEDY